MKTTSQRKIRRAYTTICDTREYCGVGSDKEFVQEVNVPGVRGGDPQRVQSPPARISDFTSPSHPSFTPSIFSVPKNVLLTGVGSNPLGGLLIALPETERGGVDG